MNLFSTINKSLCSHQRRTLLSVLANNKFFVNLQCSPSNGRRSTKTTTPPRSRRLSRSRMTRTLNLTESEPRRSSPRSRKERERYPRSQRRIPRPEGGPTLTVSRTPRSRLLVTVSIDHSQCPLSNVLCLSVSGEVQDQARLDLPLQPLPQGEGLRGLPSS